MDLLTAITFYGAQNRTLDIEDLNYFGDGMWTLITKKSILNN